MKKTTIFISGMVLLATLSCKKKIPARVVLSL
jgi:hypothetical protein